MTMGEQEAWRAPMSEHDGLQLRHELAAMILEREGTADLPGRQAQALNYLVGAAMGGMHTPEEARALAGKGTHHVLQHQSGVMSRATNKSQEIS